MFEEGNEEFEGELQEDIQRFEAFLEGEPMGFLDSDRWEALVDHFLISGNYNKALLCTDEAMSQFSFNAIFRLRKAQAFSGLGKLKESIQLLAEIERSELPSCEVFLTKAAVFSQLKDSGNAIKYFRQALELAEPEDRDEIYLDLAVEYEGMGKWNEALEVLKEAIRANPSNEGAIYEIAFCYDHLGDYEQSIKCYSDFIDENPYSFTAWYNLGNAYLRTDQFEQAVWAYDYSILINDDFGPVYFNLGNAYLSMDTFTKARESFEKSMELDGEDAMALCYVGECYERLNELESARENYKRCLELVPTLAEGWLGLGILEDLEGRTKEGIVLLHKAAELSPENAGIFHVLAGAYEKIEEFDKALEHYEASLKLDGEDEECLMNYIHLIARDSHQLALEYLERFEEEEVKNEYLELLKVELLWFLGHKEESLHLFRQCLEKDRELALELFEINPSLKSVPEFVLLGD